MRRNTWRIVAIALVCALVGGAASAAGSATPNLILGTDGRDRIAATPATDVIYAKRGVGRRLRHPEHRSRHRRPRPNRGHTRA